MSFEQDNMTMTPEDKRLNVPKLRFPEYRDAEEWRVKKAGALFENRTEDGKDGLPIYSVTMNDGMTKRSLLDRRIDNVKRSEGNKKAHKGDLVYNMMRMWQGAFGVVREDSMVSPAYVVLAPRDEVYSEFIGYLFKLPRYLRLFTSHSQGLTLDRLRLYYKDFAHIPLTLPAVPEQRKIADCLSSLDVLIAAQADKRDVIKTHKKGLMKQIFPAEGETLPRLRFPEFQEAGEWEGMTLGEIVEVASGQVDPTEPPYCNLPHIGGENIESHTGTLQNVRTSRELGLISGKFFFDERDVLYSKIRPALNKVAIPDFQGLCSADIYPLRPSNHKLSRQYLAYLLLSEQFLKYATMHSDRSKIPKVNRVSLLAYELVIPARSEQQRITDFLSSIDEMIAAHTQVIEMLKSHKKGLMQLLFPALDDCREYA